jgi:KDO2-lipid IV(A) lauroyltransferase
LRVALPDAGEKEISTLAKNVFVNFGKYLTDFFSPLNKDNKVLIENMHFEGLENIDAALKLGKGCIIVSGHFGNWELAGCALAARGYRVSAVALDHSDPRINNLFIQRRRKAGISVLSTGNAKNYCLGALKRNEIVAIIGDRPFGENGIDIEFFGKIARIPRGPALFSIRTGAPIVIAFGFRDAESKTSYKVVMEKPLLVNREGPLSKQLKYITQHFIKIFESYIRKYPSQWYMFNKVWG